MQDLLQEQQLIIKKLDYAIKEHKERGRKYAECEQDYKVALAKFIVEKRAEGVPVTILNDVARGEKHIAQARMERDIAQSLYDTCKEAINSYKLQIRVISEQMNREWNSSNK